jgi:hypothetical protein
MPCCSIAMPPQSSGSSRPAPAFRPEHSDFAMPVLREKEGFGYCEGLSPGATPRESIESARAAQALETQHLGRTVGIATPQTCRTEAMRPKPASTRGTSALWYRTT